MVIPTVAVEADKKENTVCPVCREEFDTFYKQVLLLHLTNGSILIYCVDIVHMIEFNLVNLQGEGEGDEGSWHIHNAMRTEEGLFHPECHKDKDNGMDASNVDSSMEEASSPVKKEVKEEEVEKIEDANAATCTDDNASNELTSAASPAEETVIKTEPTVPSLADNDVPMEDLEVKNEDVAAAVKVELKEDTDANDNNLDSKEDFKEEDDVTREAVKTEEVMETETSEEPAAEEEGESEEKLKHSDSLLEENDKDSLAVPVVPAKVVTISFFGFGSSDIFFCIDTANVSVIISGLQEKARRGNMFLISSLSLSSLAAVVVCNTQSSLGNVHISALENFVGTKYNGQKIGGRSG